MSKKLLVAVKVEAEMKAKIAFIAKKNTLSLPDQVRLMLVNQINQFEKERGAITQDQINQVLLFSDKE